MVTFIIGDRIVNLYYNSIALIAEIATARSVNSLPKSLRNKEVEKYELIRLNLLKSLPDRSDYVLNEYGLYLFNQFTEYQINLGKNIL